MLKLFILLLTLPSYAWTQEAKRPGTCTYEVYNWNIHKKRAVNFAKVERPYSELKEEEKDPSTGCTVCLEDQELVKVGELPPFYACRKVSVTLRTVQLRVLDTRGGADQGLGQGRP